MVETPSVTIVITPWQHFSDTAVTLESVYAYTKVPFKLVYVDGNSPRRIGKYLRAQSEKRGFTLLRSDRYLTSAEARNLAMPYVRTKYVAFLDNFTLVTDGWLEALMRCAEETGAWEVEPVYCMGDPRRPLIYSSAPDLHIIEDGNGGRRLYETAPLLRVPLADVRATLRRKECGYAKAHCALVLTEAIERTGAFDERFTSFQDHRDFSLAVKRLGGTIYSEPAAVAILMDTPKIRWSDLPFFFLRWSRTWSDPSVRHFATIWNIAIDDDALQGTNRFRIAERRKLFSGVRNAARRCGGWRAARLVDAAIDSFFDRVVETKIVPRIERRRLAAAGRGD